MGTSVREVVNDSLSLLAFFATFALRIGFCIGFASVKHGSDESSTWECSECSSETTGGDRTTMFLLECRHSKSSDVRLDRRNRTDDAMQNKDSLQGTRTTGGLLHVVI